MLCFGGSAVNTQLGHRGFHPRLGWTEPEQCSWFRERGRLDRGFRPLAETLCREAGDPFSPAFIRKDQSGKRRLELNRSRQVGHVGTAEFVRGGQAP